VVWIDLGRRPVPEADPPTIAVEFVSKSSRDRHRDYVEKRQQYAAVDVREYWVIDRLRRSMIIFRADQEIVIRAGGTYRTPLLPGFELPLDRLLAKADDYSSSD
jgi:Uma2 family endonuclease